MMRLTVLRLALTVVLLSTGAFAQYDAPSVGAQSPAHAPIRVDGDANLQKSDETSRQQYIEQAAEVTTVKPPSSSSVESTATVAKASNVVREEATVATSVPSIPTEIQTQTPSAVPETQPSVVSEQPTSAMEVSSSAPVSDAAAPAVAAEATEAPTVAPAVAANAGNGVYGGNEVEKSSVTIPPSEQPAGQPTETSPVPQTTAAIVAALTETSKSAPIIPIASVTPIIPAGYESVNEKVVPLITEVTAVAASSEATTNAMTESSSTSSIEISMSTITETPKNHVGFAEGGASVRTMAQSPAETPAASYEGGTRQSAAIESTEQPVGITQTPTTTVATVAESIKPEVVAPTAVEATASESNGNGNKNHEVSATVSVPVQTGNAVTMAMSATDSTAISVIEASSTISVPAQTHQSQSSVETGYNATTADNSPAAYAPGHTSSVVAAESSEASTTVGTTPQPASETSSIVPLTFQSETIASSSGNAALGYGGEAVTSPTVPPTIADTFPSSTVAASDATSAPTTVAAKEAASSSSQSSKASVTDNDAAVTAVTEQPATSSAVPVSQAGATIDTATVAASLGYDNNGPSVTSTSSSVSIVETSTAAASSTAATTQPPSGNGFNIVQATVYDSAITESTTLSNPFFSPSVEPTTTTATTSAATTTTTITTTVTTVETAPTKSTTIKSTVINFDTNAHSNQHNRSNDSHVIEPSGYGGGNEDASVVSAPVNTQPIHPSQAVGYDGIALIQQLTDGEPKQHDLTVSQFDDKDLVSKLPIKRIDSSTKDKIKWRPFHMDCAQEVDERGALLCGEWARGGLCLSHRATMFLFCRRTCLCVGPPKTAEDNEDDGNGTTTPGDNDVGSGDAAAVLNAAVALMEKGGEPVNAIERLAPTANAPETKTNASTMATTTEPETKTNVPAATTTTTTNAPEATSLATSAPTVVVPIAPTGANDKFEMARKMRKRFRRTNRLQRFRARL